MDEIEKGVKSLFGKLTERVSSGSVEEIDEDVENEHTKKIEAALFIAGKFLSIQELVALTDVNPILLKKILSDLEDKYRESGIDIVEKNGMWKMVMNRLGQMNGNTGVVFKRFPKSTEQVVRFCSLARDLGITECIMIYIDSPEEVCFARLRARYGDIRKVKAKQYEWEETVPAFCQNLNPFKLFRVRDSDGRMNSGDIWREVAEILRLPNREHYEGANPSHGGGLQRKQMGNRVGRPSSW